MYSTRSTFKVFLDSLFHSFLLSLNFRKIPCFFFSFHASNPYHKFPNEEVCHTNLPKFQQPAPASQEGHVAKVLIVEDSFWDKADEAPIDVVPSFEHVEEDDGEDEVFVYETLFEDHPDGEESLWIHGRS